jgi:hypothetical protein
MLVILTGSVATVAVGFATYFSYFVPSARDDQSPAHSSRAVGHVVDLGGPGRGRRLDPRARRPSTTPASETAIACRRR